MQAQHDIVDNLIAKIGCLPPAAQKRVINEAAKIEDNLAFIPSPGPQEAARRCKADILLFGGEGGGGKTSLGVGLALIDHSRSLLMRRVSTELRGLTEEAIRFNGTNDGFNGSYPQKMRAKDGRMLDFGSALYAGDELAWRGIPHDYLYIDEAGEWLGSQVRNLIGWVRSSKEGQRTRIVLGTNPPTSQDGEWMVKMFAPWLDITHPNPAKQGELRWFIMDDENDIEVAGPGKYNREGVPIADVEVPLPVALGELPKMRKIESEDDFYRQFGYKPMSPMSRTFIRSRLQNNPFLRNTDYGAKLDMMPEPLRSAVRDGNFMIARRDDLFQVIPTEWIRAAQARWLPTPPVAVPMCAMGVDIAQGGEDFTTISMRYDGWFAPIIKTPGSATPTGNEVAGLVVTHRRDEATIILDMGGGYGGSTYMRLCDNGMTESIVSYKGSEGTMKRTVDGKLKFTNTRIAAYWKLREALDPAQPGGSIVSLPPDNELVSDLTSMRFKQGPSGIMPDKESSTKVEVTKRLGRSPDKGDAVVMCWWGGKTIANIEGGWKASRTNKPLNVNIGHAERKRNRN